MVANGGTPIGLPLGFVLLEAARWRVEQALMPGEQFAAPDILRGGPMNCLHPVATDILTPRCVTLGRSSGPRNKKCRLPPGVYAAPASLSGRRFCFGTVSAVCCGCCCECLVESDSEQAKFKDEAVSRGGHPLAAFLERFAVGRLVHHEGSATTAAFHDSVVFEFSVGAGHSAGSQVQRGRELAYRGQFALGLEASNRGHHR